MDVSHLALGLSEMGSKGISVEFQVGLLKEGAKDDANGISTPQSIDQVHFPAQTPPGEDETNIWPHSNVPRSQELS